MFDGGGCAIDHSYSVFAVTVLGRVFARDELSLTAAVAHESWIMQDHEQYAASKNFNSMHAAPAWQEQRKEGAGRGSIQLI